MLHEESILRTKLTPPRLRRRTLARPRLDALLREALDCRVTIVQASTGYGKSTALASLGGPDIPLFWYNASEGDADAQQFLAHLIAAFRIGLPALADIPLALLHDTYAPSIQTAVDALLNGLSERLTTSSILVVDDYHLAASKDVDTLFDHFISFLPRDLHVIVSTRYAPEWENLVEWRARGQVLEIKRDALAFTRDEIIELFRDKYGIPLSSRDALLLEEKTEGWPIVLHLVWQELSAHPQATVAELLGRGSDSLDTLFAYLARAVLAQQSRGAQDFLLQTSVLRDLTPEACAVVSDSESNQMLAYLQRRDLFVISIGENQFRYHHLFHDFLREQARRQDPNAVRARHCRAAEFYRRAEQFDEAIYHFLQAQDFEATAQLVEEIGETVLRTGRLDTLASWIDRLPPAHVSKHPMLIFLLGDLARLRSRFDDALAWYTQAEQAWRAANDVRGIARALRGQALVYLDTVRPSCAEDLLQEALRLTDGLNDRALQTRLLEMLAENKLNMGKADEAERLREQARALREEGPSEDLLSVRVKLRTGRLDETREILETWARQERGQLHTPRAHRETLVILSLVYSMQGDGDQALDAAQEAVALAEQMHSPYVLAAGKLRLGHAHQIRGDLTEAMRCYQEAIALSDQMAVPRTRAEACLGLARAHAFAGDLASARRMALEGIAVAQNAGDAWVVALLQLCLGASLIHARRERGSIGALSDALAAFRSCGDTFGETTARMWFARAYWRLNQRVRALAFFDEALALAQAHRYDYLLTARTLFGWQDARVGMPLLLALRAHGQHATYISTLLAAMGLEQVAAHPGYQLRVQTLGTFRVWHGEEEVGAQWRRQKARELLQLFITHRHRMLAREEILEYLWAGESPEAAARDFKVALNALNKIIEPERAAEDEPSFIAREESAYGLRPGADIWIDADEFTQGLARAAALTGDAALDAYRRALALYHDDYLANDARYADWATAERERLLMLYLHAADRLARELLERGALDECLTWCERLLARDCCWEGAYRLMMLAHTRRGDRSQAKRVFEQCKQTLREHLDVEPLPTTLELFRKI